jgi:hypothetical protein
MSPQRVLAMLIRGKMSEVRGGAVDTASHASIPAATVPTLLLGGLLLLIGP